MVKKKYRAILMNSNSGRTMTLKPLMRLIVSMANSKVNYKNLMNLKNVNRSTLNANTQKNYNTIRKGLNAIKAELNKTNNAAKQRQKERINRIKARKVTTIQAHVRGVLERKKQNNSRFIRTVGPNGKMMIAVRTIPTSGFRAIAAKEQAKKLNEKRMLQGYANN